jgi:hypothetical protein
MQDKKTQSAVSGAAMSLCAALLFFAPVLSCGKNNAPARQADIVVQLQPNTPQAGNAAPLNYEVFFDPVIEFHGEAFPVKSLALAAWNGTAEYPRMVNRDDYIGDVKGDFGVSLSINGNGASGEPLPVRVEIEGDRFIRKSAHDLKLPANKKVEVFPRIAYNYAALEQLVQPASENVVFRLYIGGALVKEKMEVVRFHSVNEVPLKEISRWDNEAVIDHTFLFAAYVNEDDPLIDTILKEALEFGISEKIGFGNSFSFVGYQDLDGDEDTSLEVLLQVLAVWSVFQKHNIKYSNITTTSTGNFSIATQYVRTPQESFGNSQANCVDGSVLFASVLRKLGIEPFLVLVPGHMFVGYFLDDEFSELEFLETTMLGSANVSKATKDDSWLGKLKNWSGIGKTQSSVMRDSFLAATARAEEEWEEAADKIFDDAEEDYQIIAISDARSSGIMPVKRN